MGSNPTPRTRDEPYTLRKVFEVLWQMKKDGYSENTIEPIGKRLRNLAKHINLDNPDGVKAFIAKADWSNGYKDNLVNAYSHYAVFHKLSWTKPKYQRAYSIKKLPLEADIDLIISYTKTRNRVAFKLVKECGLRPIEVSKLTLKQIDLHNARLYPETAKGGEARVLELNSETVALLKQLVSTRNLSINDRVFPCSKTLQKNWNRLRSRVAERLGKPALKQIRLYDLRHFYGTTLYHKTKDIVYVQRKMGHRNMLVRANNTAIIAMPSGLFFAPSAIRGNSRMTFQAHIVSQFTFMICARMWRRLSLST